MGRFQRLFQAWGDGKLAEAAPVWPVAGSAGCRECPAGHLGQAEARSREPWGVHLPEQGGVVLRGTGVPPGQVPVHVCVSVPCIHHVWRASVVLCVQVCGWPSRAAGRDQDGHRRELRHLSLNCATSPRLFTAVPSPRPWGAAGQWPPRSLPEPLTSHTAATLPAGSRRFLGQPDHIPWVGGRHKHPAPTDALGCPLLCPHSV